MPLTLVPRARRLAALAPLCTALAACDIPTDAPIIEQKWALPVEGTTLSVASFLPSGVSTQGNTFAFTLPNAELSQSLGEMCTQCPSGRFTVPKPAFQAQLDASVSLPDDVAAATIAGGSVLLELDNGLGFDPLRPSQSGARGRIVSTISSGTTVLAADTIDGSSASLAAGTTLARVLKVAPSTISGPLRVQVWMDSPAGDAATVDASQRIAVHATAKDWRFASARVTLRSKSVSADQIELDLGGVDESIANRVTGGALLLAIANPFNASGQFTLEVSAPGVATIRKPLALAAGSSAPQRIDFTADELRSVLGHSDARLAVRGTVTGGDAGQTILVTPSQAIAITSTLELTLRTEER